MNTPVFKLWIEKLEASSASAEKSPVDTFEISWSPICFRTSSIGPIGFTVACMEKVTVLSLSARSMVGGGQGGGRARGGVRDRLRLEGASESQYAIVYVSRKKFSTSMNCSRLDPNL